MKYPVKQPHELHSLTDVIYNTASAMLEIQRLRETMKFDDTGKRKVYNIDIDGTLTNGEPFWAKEPTPNQPVIDAVRALYQSGNVVIVWTARQWEYAPETVAWLTKHKVPFHGVFMGKGGSDCYVDDKTITVQQLLELKI